MRKAHLALAFLAVRLRIKPINDIIHGFHRYVSLLRAYYN